MPIINMVLDALIYWHWLIIGVIFIIVELFAWSTFFLWMGVSAFIVGLFIYWVPDFSWESQFILFSLLSIVSIYLGRRLFQYSDTDNGLNNRACSYIGNLYSVVEVHSNGGKIKINDSLWIAQGCTMSIGQKVKVISTQGTILIVAPSVESQLNS